MRKNVTTFKCTNLMKVSSAISTSKNPRKYIQQDQVQKLAENKGCNGLTYFDIIIQFMCNQKQAQRTIKHFHRKGILFTNQDLIRGINGLNLKNTSPQRYYATIIKAKVIEKFKEKYENAPVKPTMDNYKYRFHFHQPLNNSIMIQYNFKGLDTCLNSYIYWNYNLLIFTNCTINSTTKRIL